jgi:4-amino-4-deoxy-L-arabinose transferase-like glycosyltransferase
MPRRPRLLLALIILAAAGVYLVGNGAVALWDRDEPRYAQTSRQMLQSGDWVVPHYLDNVRTAKPALIYWCQATAMMLTGHDDAFAARLPCAVATVILLVVLSVILWRYIGPERTVWTVFIFATSGLTIAAAKMCITDAVLLLWVTLAQLCLYAMWRGNFAWPVVITFAVAHGLAGLTKGPVLLGMQATTILALWALRLIDRSFPPSVVGEDLLPPRSVDDRRPPSAVIDYRVPPPNIVRNKIKWDKIAVRAVVALLIATAIVLPWIVMVNHRASAFLKTAVGHDVWDRMMTPLEQHTGPPGYYLLTIWATFFPWSLLLPLTIGLAIRYRAHPHTRFAMAMIIGPWIMLELVRTKLPHYLLPVFPPLAFLTADALVRCLHGQHDDVKRKGFIIGVGFWALLVALAAQGPWIVVRAFQPLPYAAMTAISIFGVVFAATVFALFKLRRPAPAAVVMGLGTFVLVTIAYAWYLPRADFLRISPRVAAVLKANDVTQPGQVLMLRYMEPSLAFYQGGTIREGGDIGFTPKFASRFTPWLVVNDEIWNKAPPELRDMFEVVAEIRGLAYADRSTWMTVMVLRRKQPPM